MSISCKQFENFLHRECQDINKRYHLSFWCGVEMLRYLTPKVFYNDVTKADMLLSFGDST